MVDQIRGSDQGIRCIRTAKEGSRSLLVVGALDCSINIRDIHSGLLLRSIMGHTKTPLDIQVLFLDGKILRK